MLRAGIQQRCYLLWCHCAPCRLGSRVERSHSCKWISGQVASSSLCILVPDGELDHTHIPRFSSRSIRLSDSVLSASLRLPSSFFWKLPGPSSWLCGLSAADKKKGGRPNATCPSSISCSTPPAQGAGQTIRSTTRVLGLLGRVPVFIWQVLDG